MTPEQERLFNDNIKLVPYTYAKYGNAFSSYPEHREDFLSEGFAGLYRAALKFDANKGVEFSTFAVYCILNNMRMYLRTLNKQPKTISGETVICRSPTGLNLTIFDCIVADDNFENIDEYMELKHLIDYAVKHKVLNKGEIKALPLILDGKTQKEMAKELGVTQCSCSRYIKNITAKLKTLYEEKVCHKRKEKEKCKKKQ